MCPLPPATNHSLSYVMDPRTEDALWELMTGPFLAVLVGETGRSGN